MEIEQPESRFQKTPGAQLAPTSFVFQKPANQPTNITYSNGKLSDKVAELSQRISSGAYGLADAFSGLPSYFLRDFENDFNNQKLLAVFQELVDNKFISNFIFGDERYNDAPSFYRADIFPDYPSKITEGNIVKKPMGHGFGKNPEEVFSKAIGEFLERYFLTLYNKKNLIRASSNGLKNKEKPVLDLKTMACFSEEQKKSFHKSQFNDSSVFWWEKTKRLSSSEDVYVPAQLIYWNYVRDEFEPFLRETNTNGAGGMFTKEGAILAALYELIQRDAFLIFWSNSLTPQRINPHSVPGERFNNLLEESERYGFEIYCLNITSDINMPTFAVVVSDPSGKSPRFSLGAGCESDPAKALRRALEEAWSVYYWMRPRPPFPALDENYRPFKEKISQDERLRLWSNPEMAKHLEFFISGKQKSFSELKFNYPASFPSQKEELDFLVRQVEKLGAGYEVYCYEAKHPLLSKVGYHSARVIVPQLIPLYLNEAGALLGSSRLKEVPDKLGLTAKLNNLPHLFP